MYRRNIFYRYNKKELTNVEIQEQTAYFVLFKGKNRNTFDTNI